MITVRNNQISRKTIDIDLNESVTISLRNKEYDDLIKSLELSMAEKIIDADNRIEKIEKKLKITYEFIEDIRKVFYDMEGDFFIMKRDLKDIELDKLDELLEKYNDYLGFQ